MDFALNEEQQLLADSVARFIEKDYDFETRKKFIASEEGWSPATWKAFAELGLLGIPLSAEAGGFGGGAVDMMAVMQALGNGLVVEPFLSTVALAGRLIDRGGSAAQKQAILPSVIDGSLVLALAQTEADSRYDLAWISTTARKSATGWTIEGEKVVVLHAPMAGKLVVSARTAGKPGDSAGVSLFVVDGNAPGVTMKTYRTQDSLRAADVTFAGVIVASDALVGPEGGGLPLLEEAVDFATALACAEAVGAMKFACDTTLEYLKTRKQFGVAIGTFQALQHRMVDMVIDTEQSRSIMYLACAKAADGTDPAERRRVISAAKVKIADSCRRVGQEAIQLHGGMGMTQELKISHAFKRLIMLAQMFGDADHHLQRFTAA